MDFGADMFIRAELAKSAIDWCEAKGLDADDWDDYILCLNSLSNIDSKKQLKTLGLDDTVARAYVEYLAEAWDNREPEELVTIKDMVNVVLTSTFEMLLDRDIFELAKEKD